MEERLSDKSEVERAKDEESTRCRKLMKLAEKYKRELNEAHVELRDLRARCLTTSDIQVSDAFNFITCNNHCSDLCLISQSISQCEMCRAPQYDMFRSANSSQL